MVAIGRNEGERLKRCLESIRASVKHVVYVDSGSTDDSVACSLALGITVVELDLSMPFTAARARNQGFTKLLELQPSLDYVFFVDGDCEVVDGWLDTAGRWLDGHSDFAVVWGSRRERFPNKSIYNLLCDVEWLDYPTGETKYCGGDAMVRVTAFRQVHGYRPDLICGEEPEMCIRLRDAQWRIFHLVDAMTLHDAAMYRFPQWWKRMQRTGYAYAQAVALHGAPPEKQGVLESIRAWTWGFVLPLITVGAIFFVGWWWIFLLAAYPLQIMRIAVTGRHSARMNWWKAVALILGKFPELHGQVQFLADRLRKVQSPLIEYK